MIWMYFDAKKTQIHPTFLEIMRALKNTSMPFSRYASSILFT